MVEYIFFDVSGTLLSKPTLYENIKTVLDKEGFKVDIKDIKFKHRLLSEVIKFPDRTDANFYKNFNSELLYLLGIPPTTELLGLLFKACSYLPWEMYEDTEILKEIDLPIGIISNFNSTLQEKLGSFFGAIFKDVLVSEELGVAKPELDFYKIAVRESGVSPEKILYIGDSIKLDLEPALQVGMKSLIVDRDGFYFYFKERINNLYEIKFHLS